MCVRHNVKCSEKGVAKLKGGAVLKVKSQPMNAMTVKRCDREQKAKKTDSSAVLKICTESALLFLAQKRRKD